MKIKARSFINITIFLFLGILIRVLEYYKVFNRFFPSEKSEAIFTIIMIAIGNGMIAGGVVAILFGIVILMISSFRK